MGWSLFVCGLPRAYEEDGSFRVRQAFPRAGEFMVSASVRSVRVGKERVFGVTECEVHLADDPGEERAILDLSQQVLGPMGEVNEAAFRALVRTGDLRIAPTLWKIVNADPGGSGWERREAVSILGYLRHVDSMPGLIRLLKDKGVRVRAHETLSYMGVFKVLRTHSWVMPSEEDEVERLVHVLLSEYRQSERSWREALHQ